MVCGVARYCAFTTASTPSVATKACWMVVPSTVAVALCTPNDDPRVRTLLASPEALVIEDATEKESPLVLAVQSTVTPLRGLPYWSAANTVRGVGRGPAALPTWLLPLETASEATAAGAPVALKVYDRLVPLI